MLRSIWINQRGLHIGDEATVHEAAADFARIASLVMPKFFDPVLLARLSPGKEAADFRSRYTPGIGTQLVNWDPRLIGAVRMHMVSDQLRQILSVITGMPIPRGFDGILSRSEPGGQQRLDWHDDQRKVGGRVLGLTLNVGTSYQGGRLQVRSKATKEHFANVGLTNPGDAVLFRISRDLEHRVTDVVGTQARLVLTGWFHDAPKPGFTAATEATLRS